MKKFTKILSISLMAVVIVAVVVTACVLSLPNANEAETVQDQTMVVNQTSVPEEETETLEPSGIYVFDKQTYTFDDVSRENSDEVISYFNTKDYNGVYNAVKDLGFDEFIANLTATVSFGITDGDVDVSSSSTDCSGKMGLLIENGNAYMVYVDGDSYYIDKSSACPCTIENGTITLTGTDGSTITYLQISYGDDSSQIALDIHFSYYDDKTAENVVTPLVVSTTMSKIENSESIFSSTSSQYVYNENSTYLVSTSTTTLNYLGKVAAMFGVENDANVMDNVLNILSGWSLSVADDFSKIFVQYSDTSIAIILNQDGLYTIDGVSFAIVLHTVDFTSKDDVLSMIITIDEDTTLTFDFIAE